ncbi:hypothetical protein ACP4OV_031315 [Aristida adscensionis]
MDNREASGGIGPPGDGVPGRTAAAAAAAALRHTVAGGGSTVNPARRGQQSSPPAAAMNANGTATGTTSTREQTANAFLIHGVSAEVIEGANGSITSTSLHQGVSAEVIEGANGSITSTSLHQGEVGTGVVEASAMPSWNSEVTIQSIAQGVPVPEINIDNGSDKLLTQGKRRSRKEAESYDMQGIGKKLKKSEEISLLRTQADVTVHKPRSLHCLGIDLLIEIFGWLPPEDVARFAWASKYLLGISKIASFRNLLRIHHTARQRSGAFLGVIVQSKACVYMPSPKLKKDLKNASESLSEFLRAESMSNSHFCVKDSRDGRLLLSKDNQATKFTVCNPFKEPYYSELPICPIQAPNDEENVMAAFIPEDSSNGFTVIALCVKQSDRSLAYIKKFSSTSGGWDCSAVNCSFSFPAISTIRKGSVLSGGCIYIVIPSVGFISLSPDNLTIRAFAFPEHSVLAMALRRHRTICRTRNGDICLAVVRAETTMGKRGRVISIFRFSWISHDWELRYEWADPRRVPCLNLIGFAEGQGILLLGTGWDSVFALDIESGRLSHEMQNTGAKEDVLAYETEYPSSSWWEFSR